MADTRSLYKSAEGHAAVMAWYDCALQNIGVDYQSLIFDTRYGETHVIACGPQDAPPLLLVEGLGGNALLWKPQLSVFLKNFRVYAVDVIGQTGRSAPTRPPHTGPAYAEWLVDVLDALRVERTNVVGISFGGRLTLKLGAHAPHRIIKAVLLSPIGLVAMDFKLFLRLLPTGLNLNPSGGETARRLIRTLFTLPETTACREVEDLFVLFGKHYRQESISGLPMAFPLPQAELRRFNVPTLLLMGQREQLFNPRRVIERAQKILPDLREADLIPDAGHILNYDQTDIVNYDQTDIVNDRILSFL
jgi:pimeloyl-ACP methyl ester carboxylesterase